MVVLLALAVGGTACSHNGKDPEPTPPEPPVQETNLDKAEENLRRSLTLTQSALEHCFKGNSMLMMRYYYPFIGTTSLEKASVWMYTSSLEAVNALLSGMEDLKEAGRPELYDTNSEALKKTLGDLFDGLDWYKGTYTLTPTPRQRNGQSTESTGETAQAQPRSRESRTSMTTRNGSQGNCSTPTG